MNKKKCLIDIPLVHARSCPGGRNFIFVTLLFECFVEFSAKKKIPKEPLKTAQKKKCLIESVGLIDLNPLKC